MNYVQTKTTTTMKLTNSPLNTHQNNKQGIHDKLVKIWAQVHGVRGGRIDISCPLDAIGRHQDGTMLVLVLIAPPNNPRASIYNTATNRHDTL
jgi:hypothetical protein